MALGFLKKMRIRLSALFMALCLATCALVAHAELQPTQFSAMNDLCQRFGPKTGWKCGNNPCAWTGVTCNPQGTSVTHLIIPKVALDTVSLLSIPSSISALSDLVFHNLRLDSVYATSEQSISSQRSVSHQQQVTFVSSKTTASASKDSGDVSKTSRYTSGAASLASVAQSSPNDVNATEVYPIAHCWVSVRDNTTLSFYALFGYESTTSLNASGPIYNITGGFESTPPRTTFVEGRNLLVFAIAASEPIVTMNFMVLPNANETLTPSDYKFLSQSINTTNQGSQCPNTTLDFIVTYPSPPTTGDLAANVRELYSAAIPYPINLINTSNYNWNETRRAAFAVGDIAVTMAPGATENPFFAYTNGLAGRSLPGDASTGAAEGGVAFTSYFPSTGGEPTPEDIPPPPGLNSSAKGAIAICIIVGVLIVAAAIFLFCLRSTHKLPTTTREDQSKLIRRNNRTKNGDVEQGRHGAVVPVVNVPNEISDESPRTKVVPVKKKNVAKEEVGDSEVYVAKRYDSPAATSSSTNDKYSSSSSTPEDKNIRVV